MSGITGIIVTGNYMVMSAAATFTVLNSESTSKAKSITNTTTNTVCFEGVIRWADSEIKIQIRASFFFFFPVL